MSHVLILTASYGSGHNAAARCLAAAFERAGARGCAGDRRRSLPRTGPPALRPRLARALLRDAAPGAVPLGRGLRARRLDAERLALALRRDAHRRRTPRRAASPARCRRG